MLVLAGTGVDKFLFFPHRFAGWLPAILYRFPDTSPNALFGFTVIDQQCSKSRLLGHPVGSKVTCSVTGAHDLPWHLIIGQACAATGMLG